MRRSTSRGWPVRWRYPTGLSIGGGPQRQWHCKPSTSARASSEFLLSKVKIAVVVRQLDRGHILWCGRVVRVERAHGVRVVRGVEKMLDVGRHGVIEFGHIWFVPTTMS